MEIEQKIEWLKPERVMKLTNEYKSLFGMNRLFIIGLGKNGVDCALQCKHITEKRFGTDPKKVRFLAVAEDKYLDGVSCEGTVFGEGECLPIIPEEAIYKYLNNPARLPQSAVSWFDSGLKNYSPATPTYGLTKRQCGRIALFHNMKELLKLVGDAIQGFGGSDKSLEIVLTGNMGDVFFGGMFIDLAYILKQLFDGSSYPVKISCYMFAPDTAVLFETDQREQGNYFANTVLSRNELEMFQCSKRHFSQKYTASFEVNSDKPPFNAVFIARAEKNYNYTLDCAAEKILNRMEILFSKDDDAERIMSYNLLNQSQPHDFRYLSYGVRVKEIPMGKLVSYLCVKMFTLINHALNRNNVGQLLLGQYGNLCTPDIKLLAQKGGDLPSLEFDERINPAFSAKSLRHSSDAANDYIESWLDRMDESTKKGAEVYRDEAVKSIKAFCEEAKCDYTKGPFYAAELVKKCLADLRVATAKTNAELSDMEEQVERARNLERKAYMKIKTSPLFVNKSIEQYIYEIREYADYACKLRTGGTMLEFYKSLTEQLSDYLENVIGRATEAFENIAVNRKAIIDELSADNSENCCAVDAFSLHDEGVSEKLDKLVENVPEGMISKALADSGILSVSADDETMLAKCAVSIVYRCFSSFLSLNYSEMCDFFGFKDVMQNSLRSCIDEVEVATPVSDSFALNRVICPKTAKQDDITALRSIYKGMNYIWNGSVMNYTTAVAQIKGGVKLEDFPDYTQWENMHYAYVNDSLKKHGIHIF